MNFIKPKWTYSEHGTRDLRLDWLRGYATMAMVIDHIGDKSWLYIFTGGDEFFLSAAEAFVFISGMIVGVVYGRVLREHGFFTAARKALKRAWTLYRLTVVLTVLFVTASAYFEFPWADWIDLSVPWEFVFDVATLRRTFILVDIPLMYTLLMASAPIGFFFLRAGGRRLAMGLALSWALWLMFQFPEFHVGTHAGILYNWTFKYPTWQLLFFNAMALGYHRDYLTGRLRSMTGITLRIFQLIVSLLLASFLFLIALYFHDGAMLDGILPPEFRKDLSAVLFAKAWLGPGRLVAAAVLFPLAYRAITTLWKPLYSRTHWMVLLGGHSLYAYTMHVVLLTGFYALIPVMPFYWDFEILTNSLVEIGTIFAIYWMIRTKFLFHIVPR